MRLRAQHFRITVGLTYKANGKRMGWRERRIRMRQATEFLMTSLGHITWSEQGGGWFSINKSKTIRERTVTFELGITSNFDPGCHYKRAIHVCDWLRKHFEQDSVYLVTPRGNGFIYKG